MWQPIYQNNEKYYFVHFSSNLTAPEDISDEEDEDSVAVAISLTNPLFTEATTNGEMELFMADKKKVCISFVMFSLSLTD